MLERVSGITDKTSDDINLVNTPARARLHRLARWLPPLSSDGGTLAAVAKALTLAFIPFCELYRSCQPFRSCQRSVYFVP